MNELCTAEKQKSTFTAKKRLNHKDSHCYSSKSASTQMIRNGKIYEELECFMQQQSTSLPVPTGRKVFNHKGTAML